MNVKKLKRDCDLFLVERLLDLYRHKKIDADRNQISDLMSGDF